MGAKSGRLTMTDAYAKRVLADHPEWVIIDGVLGVSEADAKGEEE